MSESIEAQIKRLTPLARYHARRWTRTLGLTCTYEDLLGIALVALWESVRDFDESHGAALPTYATVRMTNALNAEWTHWRRKKRFGIRLGDSIESAAEDETPIALVASNPSQEDLVDARRVCDIIASLPKRERRVLELRSEGIPLRAVGRKLGLSGEMVRQLEVRAIELARRSLERPRLVRSKRR